MTTMQVIIGALLLAEATFSGLAEASRPDLSGLYQILENR
ncbi:type VI secretion system protein TssA, partial [Klebsiella pneumoniae]|nr:type VI secretion system protein TssA [Klebsiella pneumoniae]